MMIDNKDSELCVADISNLLDDRSKLLKEMDDAGIFDKKDLAPEEIERGERVAYYLGILISQYSIVNSEMTRLEFLMKYCMVDIISGINDGLNVRVWLPCSADSLTCEDIYNEHLKYFVEAMEQFIGNDEI